MPLVHEQSTFRMKGGPNSNESDVST